MTAPTPHSRGPPSGCDSNCGGAPAGPSRYGCDVDDGLRVRAGRSRDDGAYGSGAALGPECASGARARPRRRRHVRLRCRRGSRVRRRIRLRRGVRAGRELRRGTRRRGCLRLWCRRWPGRELRRVVGPEGCSGAAAGGGAVTGRVVAPAAVRALAAPDGAQTDVAARPNRDGCVVAVPHASVAVVRSRAWQVPPAPARAAAAGIRGAFPAPHPSAWVAFLRPTSRPHRTRQRHQVGGSNAMFCARPSCRLGHAASRRPISASTRQTSVSMKVATTSDGESTISDPTAPHDRDPPRHGDQRAARDAARGRTGTTRACASGSSAANATSKSYGNGSGKRSVLVEPERAALLDDLRERLGVLALGL